MNQNKCCSIFLVISCIFSIVCDCPLTHRLQRLGEPNWTCVTLSIQSDLSHIHSSVAASTWNTSHGSAESQPISRTCSLCFYSRKHSWFLWGGSFLTKSLCLSHSEDCTFSAVREEQNARPGQWWAKRWMECMCLMIGCGGKFIKKLDTLSPCYGRGIDYNDTDWNSIQR